MSNIIINTVSMLLQTIVLSYCIAILSSIFSGEKYSKSQIIISSICLSISPIVSTFIKIDNIIAKMLLFSIPPIFSMKIIYKNSSMKSIIITICTYIFFAITELVAMFFVVFIFKCNSNDILNNTSILLTLIIIQMILMLFLIKLLSSIISRFTKFSELAKDVNSNQILNLILIISICILPNIIITALNSYNFNVKFLVIYCLETIAMAITIFIFFKRTLERDKAQSELFISETHNKTMVGMVDGVRTLKHDYNNIMQALNGYVVTKQYDKLEEHIKKVLQECNVVNNLSIITPELFNEPAIYGVMGAKYFLAIEKDIPVDIEVICDFTKVSFSMPDLSRILGILLDNAMEATINSKEPYIKFEAIFDKRKNADVIKVINTYDTSININLEKIYEKGVSSKKVKSGIGLWEVKKIIKKNKNAQIYPTIEKGKFVQNIIIERLFEYEEPDKEEGALIIKDND